MEESRIKRFMHFLGFDENLMTVRTITRVAVLSAMAIILKTYLNIDLGVWRFTFYGIPLMILGIVVGPMAGILGGLAADFGYIMYKGMMYGINVFTISAVLWGLIPALFLFKKGYSFKKVAMVVVLTSSIVFMINTYGLVHMFGPTNLVLWQDGIPGPLLIRLFTYLIKLPVQIYVLDIVVSRLKAFMDFEYSDTL